MRFSVVVPTYNRADLIGATIDAILAQDSPPLEVIVVDDGSTDETCAVLAAYGDRVRTISVPNGGDLVARNVGMRAATGSHVAFCDSDDLWLPGYLSAMAEVWTAFPDIVTAYGNFRLFRDDSWEDTTKFDQAPPGFFDGIERRGAIGAFHGPVVDRLMGFQPFFTSSMTADRAAFLAMGGWDESVSRLVGCDFATALRSAEQPVGILFDALVGIRRHAGNFSGDVQKMNLGDARILEHLLATRPALAAHRGLAERSIASRRADAADTAFDRRDFGAVRSAFALLPTGERTTARRAKALISALPSPLARAAARMLSK